MSLALAAFVLFEALFLIGMKILVVPYRYYRPIIVDKSQAEDPLFRFLSFSKHTADETEYDMNPNRKGAVEELFQSWPLTIALTFINVVVLIVTLHFVGPVSMAKGAVMAVSAALGLYVSFVVFKGMLRSKYLSK